MRNAILFVLVVVLILAAGVPAKADGLSAVDAFANLKSLAGSWQGIPEGEGAEAEAEAAATQQVVHEFEVSAAGTVVMETMNPGTEHEMINMYHMNGDDLVLTHYCAGGNQPTMRLDRASSSAEQLVFDFTGGTNFDPAVDNHIHSARITLVGENRLDSIWTAHAGGEEVGKMTFHLGRSE